MKEIPVTVGICAYNEEGNIERSIRSVYQQKYENVSVSEVIVISSGSTDGTDEIVRGMLDEYPNLRFIPQEKREGKNSAINLLLDKKSTEIVILLNADNTLCDESTISNLIRPFFNDKVGIVGGRPIPTNTKDTLAGFASNMLWTLHHRVSLLHPKIGELVAFRDIGTRLPMKSQSDEDLLRMNLERKGYQSIYAPDAIIRNRGPETLRDFIKQRTRVNIGERYMKREFDYDIPTWDKGLLFSAVLDSLRDLGFHPIKISLTVAMEMYARMKASSYVRSDKGDMGVWDPVKSTKKL